MEGARIQRLRDLFERAVSLDGDQRCVFLEEVLAEDGELAQELADLLERDAELRRTIEQGLAALAGKHPEYGEALERLRVEFGRVVASTAPEIPDSHRGRSHALLGRIEGRGTPSERYIVEGEIARGGMGSIVRVWDLDLSRPLAMKVQLETAAQPCDRERSLVRFLDEARITGQLDHPGIVPVHEVGADPEGRAYFTMKLVQGRDLEQIFRLVRAGEEGWTTTRAVRVVHRVCEAMAYAHAKGVIHRDLKPANVMVGGFGEVYVMDWGLARAETRATDDERALVPDLHRDEPMPTPQLTREGEVLGTPAYMSPEQASGKGSQLGLQSDVYAIGAILYRLLAGRAPYTDGGPRNALQVLQLLATGPPTSLREIAPDAPLELVAIAEKAMSRQVEARYSDVSGLADDIEAWLEGRVVSAHEAGAWAEAKKWVRRNRALAASIAAALAIALGGLGSVTYTAAKGRRIADAERTVAVRERANVLRLSAFQRLEDLEAEAASLWPAVPEQLPRFDDWLARAREFVAGLDPDPANPEDRGHRGRLAELHALRIADPDAVDGWRYPDEASRWWAAQLEKLVSRAEAFVDSETGLMGAGISRLHGAWGMKRRRDWAAGLRELSLEGHRARASWEEALASIADPMYSPEYDGLAIAPQLGLVPVGQDPRSGLWEFADLQTGELPERGANGQLAITEASAIVMVLVPGGRFLMGAQNEDSEAPNYDASARPQHETPVHEVQLEPFFISKYEMTQGQWLRLSGINPSRYATAPDVDPTHPVERVSWRDCMTLLPRHLLRLPSEAEWEYAARAGTSTSWWTGNERDDLVGVVNLADQAAARKQATWPAIQVWPELDDGYDTHAPVGSFRANPFGLHDVYGNVGELCLDEYITGFYEQCGALVIAPVANQGDDSDRDYRVVRGGSFYEAFHEASSAFRSTYAATYSGSSIGLRPARSLD